MDKKMRELERKAILGDEDALRKYLQKKVSMGQGKAKVFFKLKYGDKFFSKDSRPNSWVKAGTRFKSKVAALNAFQQALNLAEQQRNASYSRWREFSRNLLNTKIDQISLVEITTYSIERDCSINIVEERTKSELAKLRQQREEIEQQEKKLLAEVDKKRKELLARELKLQKAAK